MERLNTRRTKMDYIDFKKLTEEELREELKKIREKRSEIGKEKRMRSKERRMIESERRKKAEET